MTDKCFRALMKIASGAYGVGRLNPPPTPPEPAKKPAATSNKENEPAANDKGFKPQPSWLTDPQQRTPQPVPQNKKPYWIDRYLNNNKVPKTAAAPAQKQPSIKPMPTPPGGYSNEGVSGPPTRSPEWQKERQRLIAQGHGTVRKPAAKPAAKSTPKPKKQDGSQVDYNAPLEKRQMQVDWLNQTGLPLPPNLR